MMVKHKHQYKTGGINNMKEFRAWNTDHKTPTMEYFNLFDAVKHLKDKQITRYTGLEDIKNKAVYEGDIIKVFDPDVKYQIQEVVFKDGGFCGYSETKQCKYTWLDVLIRAHSIEVIGNVFESPELIKR